jgi:hypothetical protein
MDNEWMLPWIILAAIGLAIVLTVAIASRQRSRARSLELQRRFGPEYDRAVQELGPRRAERELAARARRVEHFQFRDLSTADRGRFASSWSRIQLQFVDDPALAVTSANELIKEVMRARGYPTEDFEQRAADLSVEHPAVVQHYRAAKALAESNRAGQASTEELRQAVVHYRVLFNELLQPPSRMPMQLQPAPRTG